MAIEVKHTTQATGTDAGNGEIRKAQWNEAHTLSMDSGNLLGRSTSGAGVVEEISIGSGLSLSGGMLSASGGGGGSSTLTISNKTAAYTVVAGDNGTIINCSGGSFTISLTAAATLGAGFNCWVWNTTYGTTITIDPNASETIDGQSTLLLRSGEGTQIICDGAKWQTGDKKTMRGYAESMDESSRASVAGLRALAIGYNANCASSYGTALGQNSNAQGSVTNAAGNGAMALGGSYSSGTDSFAAAVANNTSSYGATGSGAVAVGYQSKCTGGYSLALGYASTAASNYATALGRGCNAGASYSVAMGYGANAAIVGKFAFSSSISVSAGEAQTGTIVLRRQTTDETATVLTSNGSAASASNQVILPNNSAYAFTGTVVARQSAAGGTASAAWKVEGLIRREGTAGTTTLVASTVTAISNAPGWTLALSADTSNGGLAITATGAAATNIAWVATIQTSEVVYP